MKVHLYFRPEETSLQGPSRTHLWKHWGVGAVVASAAAAAAASKRPHVGESSELRNFTAPSTPDQTSFPVDEPGSRPLHTEPSDSEEEPQQHESDWDEDPMDDEDLVDDDEDGSESSEDEGSADLPAKRKLTGQFRSASKLWTKSQFPDPLPN